MIDADIYQIKEVDAYPFDYHECTLRASDELKNNARPQILDPLESIDEYDTIYLGYPNWWSTMPTIVMTFLESYDFTNKHIYPICSLDINLSFPYFPPGHFNFSQTVQLFLEASPKIL